MEITKQHLDTRICDHIEGTSNTETYREFIRGSEKEFGFIAQPIDSMTDEKLNEYIDLLDYLWDK